MFDLFLRHRRQPAVSKDIDSLLTGVLQDAQDPDGIKFACANDLLADLCGPLRDAMINSLPNQFPAVRSRIGKKDTIVIVAAAVGEQAPIDRCLYAVISDFLGWLVYRTWLFDDIYQYPPILAAASTRSTAAFALTTSHMSACLLPKQISMLSSLAPYGLRFMHDTTCAELFS
jgi:hypothetical protein